MGALCRPVGLAETSSIVQFGAKENSRIVFARRYNWRQSQVVQTAFKLNFMTKSGEGRPLLGHRGRSAELLRNGRGGSKSACPVGGSSVTPWPISLPDALWYHVVQYCYHFWTEHMCKTLWLSVASKQPLQRKDGKSGFKPFHPTPPNLPGPKNTLHNPDTVPTVKPPVAPLPCGKNT